MRWGKSKHLLKWTQEKGYFLFKSGGKKKKKEDGLNWVIWSYFSSAPLQNIVWIFWENSSVNYKSWAWNCKLHQDWHNEKSQKGSLQSLILLFVPFCILLWLSSESSYIFHISWTEKGYLLYQVLLGTFCENLYFLIDCTDFPQNLKTTVKTVLI